MKTLKILAATTLLWATFSSHFLTNGSGADGEITINNHSAQNIVVGFYTDDGEGWSAPTG
ncbi:MAG: hypothetical protein JKY49_02525 [Cohaesibacteraceae bacterium]|nr:hypothetical protein [Cohaesibacteraceae bacterium]